MIRKARLTDIPQIVDVCRDAWDRGGYPIEFCPTFTLHEVRKSIKLQSGIVYVSEINGVIEGVVSGFLTKFQKGMIAHNEMFYVRKGGEGLKLLMTFRDWAKENAGMVSISVSFGNEYERVGKLIELAGFKKVGGSYRV